MNLLKHMNYAGDSKIRPEMDELSIPGEYMKWDKIRTTTILDEWTKRSGRRGIPCTTQ
jgi:hypothetical protein